MPVHPDYRIPYDIGLTVKWDAILLTRRGLHLPTLSLSLSLASEKRPCEPWCEGGGVKPYNPRRAPASTSSARWSPPQLPATTWASVRLQKTGSPQIRLSDTNPTRLAFLDTGHSVSVARGSYLWLDIRLHWTWTFCLLTSPLLSEVGPIPSSLRFTWNHFYFHNGKRYEKNL